MLSKKCQSEGLKKVLKRGTGRFFIERRVSKEEQIKPACITFPRNKWNGRTYFSQSHYCMIHHVSILFKR